MTTYTPFTAAAIQMVSGVSVSDNLKTAQKLIKNAKEAGAKLVALPEVFASFNQKQAYAIGLEESQLKGGPIQHFLSDQAKQHQLYLVAGSIPMAHTLTGQVVGHQKVRSACLVYNDQGQCMARYDKIHLFDVSVNDRYRTYQESKTYEPGTEPVVVNTPLGCLGLSICYDLRFGALYRVLSDLGARIVVVPSAFTQATGCLHWHTLLRARAIEHQCFVIAPNQGGRHDDKRQTYGHSMIINPQGVILNCLNQGEGVVCATIDLSIIDELEKTMPVKQHQRLHYAQLSIRKND